MAWFHIHLSPRGTHEAQYGCGKPDKGCMMEYEHFTVQDLWRLMNGQASFAPFLTDNPWVRVDPTPDGVLITPRTTHPDHTICLYAYGDVDGINMIETRHNDSSFDCYPDETQLLEEVEWCVAEMVRDAYPAPGDFANMVAGRLDVMDRDGGWGVRTMPDGVMWVTTSQGQSWRVAIDDDMQVGGCDFELADCRQLWVGITPENADGEPDWQGYDTTGQAVHDVAAWLIQDRCRTHNQG